MRSVWNPYLSDDSDSDSDFGHASPGAGVVEVRHREGARDGTALQRRQPRDEPGRRGEGPRVSGAAWCAQIYVGQPPV